MNSGALGVTHRGRARAIAVAFVLLAIFGVGMAQMWPAAASNPTPDTNINDYTILAKTKLEIKGGNGGTSDLGGNIGVIGVPGSPPAMTICGSGNPVHMDDGTQIVADSVRSTNACDFYDLFVNSQSGGTLPGVRDSQNT